MNFQALKMTIAHIAVSVLISQRTFWSGPKIPTCCSSQLITPRFSLNI